MCRRSRPPGSASAPVLPESRRPSLPDACSRALSEM
ncbi:30S ribosomal protein S11 [Rhodococcus opacus PD630]|uniref:Possible 30S ribosomal subunit n=1 Tax=Rhodococcus jostii (strain RHA1) TaxID=101510 RepID=Q0S3D7_RHOJR|nr:possible 30S ribosomal subunit [Rhodococcus jostii RHA1]EHI46366.1 30S ribosomal protein S11 [Rhodococcus opacus PD630]